MSDKNDYNANLFGDSLDILLALAVRQAEPIAELQSRDRKDTNSG
jgi:hypothetical protein